MAMTFRARVGRIGYGLLFCVVLPATLACWACRLPVGSLPVLHWPMAGAIVAAGGVAVMLAAMASLVHDGRGLPMNAFPPTQLVAKGLYELLPHPIYVGFVVACAGVALGVGSAAGLWVVTPLVALGLAALVWGHERPDLLRRFGRLPRAWLSLPPGGGQRPTMSQALATGLVIFIPWIISYRAILLLTGSGGVTDVRSVIERSLPAWTWSAPLHASICLLVPLALFLASSRSALRRFGIQSIPAIGAISLFYLLWPTASAPRDFASTGWSARLLRLAQAWSSPPVAALPAFPVVWACLAAELLEKRSRWWAGAAWLWAAAASLACVTTGLHAMAGVGAAWLTYLALRYFDLCYGALIRRTELLANSWHQWRIGPVRVMSHGIYAGLAGLVGVAGAVWLSRSPGGVVVVALCGLAGAALYAQWIEGSPALLRPFGYYGYLLGAVAGAAVCGVAGGPGWSLLAAGAMVAPWAQALGRLRCLAQGCCHGRPSGSVPGIRVHNSHSRVCKMAALIDVPIHPTQLYAILANIVIGLLLARLWVLGARLALVAGSYFILGGLARFVEETYRGEPQTPRWAGLAVYHWMAIASVAGGMVLCVLPSGAATSPSGPPGWTPILAGLAAGVVFWVAMGVDLPDSRRRFARLSG
jgi:protein-S-isoprenylcysteine O-methyltransferase Ste14